MLFLAVAVVIVLGLALAGLLVGEARGSRRVQWATKPIASAAFLALPFALGGPQGAAGWAIVAGLVLAFVGDLLLIPAAQEVFLVGIVAFLLAHVAYVAGFALLAPDAGRMVAAGILLAIGGVLLSRWFLPSVPPSLKPAVVAYVVVISLMVAFAVGVSWRAAGFALAFYLSDLTVARHRFVAPDRRNRLVGLPLYYLAQVGFGLLAAGVFR